MLSAYLNISYITNNKYVYMALLRTKSNPMWIPRSHKCYWDDIAIMPSTSNRSRLTGDSGRVVGARMIPLEGVVISYLGLMHIDEMFFLSSSSRI